MNNSGPPKEEFLKPMATTNATTVTALDNRGCAELPTAAFAGARPNANPKSNGSFSCHGINNAAVFAESPETNHRALEQLEQAMNMIGDDQKAEYMEALRRCPALVRTESDPIRFLRSEDFNSWKAALRLTVYWKKRVSIFGKKDAFLPMVLSGQGALTPQDVAAVRSGYLSILPPDRSGHTIYCADRSRLPASVADDKNSRLRALFYMLQVGSENITTQREGLVMLLVLPSQSSQHHKRSFDRSSIRESIEIFWQAMPIKAKSMHVVSCPPKKARRTFLETIVPITMERLGKFLTKICQVHVGDTDTVVEKLIQCGFTKQGLPTTVGGTWSYDRETARWCRERCATEALRYELGAPVAEQKQDHKAKQESPQQQSDQQMIGDFLHNKPAVDLSDSAIAARSMSQLGVSSSQTKKHHHESATKGHAIVKKKKKRTHDTLESLNEALSSLKPSPSNIESKQAARKVEEISTAATSSDERRRKEFLRKRNAIYSRRKYIRKKIELQVLEQQSRDLKAQNHNMKQEQHRLEGLLQQARECVTLHGSSCLLQQEKTDKKEQMKHNSRPEVAKRQKQGPAPLLLSGLSPSLNVPTSLQANEPLSQPAVAGLLGHHRSRHEQPLLSTSLGSFFVSPAQARRTIAALDTTTALRRQEEQKQRHSAAAALEREHHETLRPSLLNRTRNHQGLEHTAIAPSLDTKMQPESLSCIRDQQEQLLRHIFAANDEGREQQLDILLRRLRPSFNSDNDASLALLGGASAPSPPALPPVLPPPLPEGSSPLAAAIWSARQRLAVSGMVTSPGAAAVPAPTSAPVGGGLGSWLSSPFSCLVGGGRSNEAAQVPPVAPFSPPATETRPQKKQLPVNTLASSHQSDPSAGSPTSPSSSPLIDFLRRRNT